MEKILTFLFLLLGWNSFAQLVIENAEYDFGLLLRADPNWADFTIRNEGKETAWLFRVENPSNTEVLFSTKKILPDSSAIVRVQYNPEEAGKFKETMNLFASAWSEPQKLTIKGQSTFSTDKNIPCPDFEKEPGQRMRPYYISVRTTSGNPIPETSLSVIRDGERMDLLETDANGEIATTLPLDWYLMNFDYRGQVMDTTVFVSGTNNHLVVYLDPQERPSTATVPVDKSGDIQVPSPELEVAPNPSDLDINSKLLPLSEFSESNLVFLVDVSASMRNRGRLELLKVAMIDLLEVLRPVDRFTLISYASDAGILIETQSNLDKEACRKAIAELKARGDTDGANAIDRAGKAALKSFLLEGNNQIILATDGGFNEGASKAIKLSRKFKRKGIKLSVLGIRCSSFASNEMMELAENGGGQFVAIDEISDAGEELIKEIKRSAKK